MDKHALDPACLLGDRLQTLSRAELTALAEALCRILTERGTYHGGIRPDNISRAADGTVGLGAPARTDTKDWTTEELEFMAPEVFWSGTLDASADVYSIGLRAVLKAPLLALCGGHNIANLIRYALMVIFAAGIWPMTFRWFGRLGRNKPAPGASD